MVKQKYKYVHGLPPLKLCDEIGLVSDRHDINIPNSNSPTVVVPKPYLYLFLFT